MTTTTIQADRPNERPVNICSNSVPRDILYWWNLTAKEQKEFDYLDTETSQNDGRFFRYRGWTYDLGEFMCCDRDMFGTLKAWDGYQSDSFYSGIVVKYRDNFERVIVGTYYA